MYKYIALFLIFGAICYIGYLLKLSYKRKVDFFELYNNFLEYTLFEIKNNKSDFENIIDKYLINNKNLFSNILEKYKANLYNINNTKIISNGLFLTKFEAENIKLFFNKIATLDFDSAIIFINKNIIIVNGFIDSAKKDLQKKGELYFKLSIMLAFFITIILI